MRLDSLMFYVELLIHEYLFFSFFSLSNLEFENVGRAFGRGTGKLKLIEFRIIFTTSNSQIVNYSTCMFNVIPNQCFFSSNFMITKGMGYYLGEPCNKQCNAILFHIYCNTTSHRCECLPEYPVNLDNRICIKGNYSLIQFKDIIRILSRILKLFLYYFYINRSLKIR